MDPQSVAQAIRRAENFEPTRGPFFGFSLGLIRQRWPDQIRQRARGRAANDEARVIQAYAQFIASFEKLAEVTRNLAHCDTGASLFSLQIQQHMEELQHRGLPPGNQLQLVSVNDQPPQDQHVLRGRRPVVEIGQVQAIVPYRAPEQPVNPFWAFLWRVRCFIAQHTWYSAVIAILAPLLSMVLPKLIIWLLARLVSFFIEAFVTGITDAAEQAAKEGEFVAAKVSHLVSESLDVGISVGMEDGGNSTLTTSRVTAPCWLILSSAYLIRTWMWTRAAAL